MSVSPEFLARIERLFPGRDYLAPKTKLRNHGTSSIKYGRGSVLTVDLTNRCNMMCDPCFMDANQVGYVHELTWDEVTKILDDSLSIQPRRQMFTMNSTATNTEIRIRNSVAGIRALTAV